MPKKAETRGWGTKLWGFLKTSLKTVLASAATGAAAGAGIGAFFGGIGALPGAAVGAIFGIATGIAAIPAVNALQNSYLRPTQGKAVNALVCLITGAVAGVFLAGLALSGAGAVIGAVGLSVAAAHYVFIGACALMGFLVNKAVQWRGTKAAEAADQRRASTASVASEPPPAIPSRRNSPADERRPLPTVSAAAQPRETLAEMDARHSRERAAAAPPLQAPGAQQQAPGAPGAH